MSRYSSCALLGALFLGLAGSSCSQIGEPPAVPSDPAKLEQALQAYLTGLAASDAADIKTAEMKLTESAQLAPGEAAIWANLALQSLRANRIDEAIERIGRAQALQAKDTDILTLAGIARSRKGASAEALALFSEAAKNDPKNVRARYSAFQEMERSGKPDAGDKMLAVLGEIVAVQPENLAARLELVHRSLDQGKTGGIDTSTEYFGRLENHWTEDARAVYAQLKNALGRGDLESAKTSAAGLKNLLKPNPVYRFSYDQMQYPPGEVYPTLRKAFVLKLPPATPSPEDAGIRFETKPASHGSGNAWVGVRYPSATEPPILIHRSVTSPASGSANLGMCEADLNSDFKNDVVFFGPDGLQVMIAQPNGTLKDKTASWKLPAELTAAPVAAVLATDIESDGDLDLVVAPNKSSPWVLRNNGDGDGAIEKTFAGCPPAVAASWADFDGDGDQDIAFIAKAGGLLPYRNERGGRYTGFDGGEETKSAVALAAADLDRNGIMDFGVLKGDGSLLRWSAEDMIAISHLAGLETTSQGAIEPGAARLFAEDIDLNGATDLIVSLPTGSSVHLAKPDGSYGTALKLVDWQITALADLNGDGRIDLAGIGPGGTMEATGFGSKPYHFQRIAHQAKDTPGDGRLNSFLIGGELDTRAGLLNQLTPITRPVTLLGLGENKKTSYTRLRLPDGCYQAEYDVKPDQLVKIEQRLKGSCPWLFAWNGKAMEFVTDFIWRSPLGLKINAQGTADVADTFDRVLIRGERLVARNGFYDLRITADLWETHFFDLIRLAAIDHPEGTEVYVDERYAIPPPSLKTRVTQPVRPVVAAHDDTGTDVLELVKRRDGTYLDTFGRGKYQGVTRPHYVEVDLGTSAPASDRLLLVAHGWIHPTDSSINVAIGQGNMPAPSPLRAEVPDEKGGWRILHENLGFPSGKLKTILVDLKGAFTAGSERKVRLRTNLEIYWDFIGWTVELPGTERKETFAERDSAELRYRGFSEVVQANESSPELPNYGRIAEAGRPWRELVGYYTRFGEIGELVNKVDDRYVIMNAGDELVLRFRELPAPPSGWKRDYILEGDGWVKDGNLNTTFSKTVLPLPSHADRAYKAPPGKLEADPVYRKHTEDWRTYHTRYVASPPSRSSVSP